MKLSKYKNYIDLTSNWIDRIPSGWNLERFTDVFMLNKGLNITKADLIESGIPCVNYGEIHSKYGFELDPQVHKLKFVSETYLVTGVSALLKKGDFVFADTSEDIEGAGNFTYLKTNETTFAGYHTIIAKPHKSLNSRYLAYLFSSESFRTQLRSQIKGVKVFSITNRILNSLQILKPSIVKQVKIVEYLDAKVYLVDKKVSLLKKKKAKYNELRKTLIKDVVTNGLDKYAETKNSEIEWTDQIPIHWKVQRVKDIFEISRGRVIAQTELEEEGYPVYSSQTENDGCMGYINTFDFDADLLTWTTDGVNAGTVFLRSGKFNCTNICGVLRPKNKNSIFLNYLVHSVQESAKHNKRIDTNGAKIMSNEMAFIKILVPPLSEQIEIANYIDKKKNNIDKIIKSIDAQINILKEFRKTLINDVVTGKAKVT